ncbi:hypothetical protein AMAG_05360 [Allomyces macrogynus ATCC 38327]|uniref:Protein phosphatase 1 regulatory subunit 7 n=1 Tax=Allomyces macrogynus (strain ATCC 38327) TaxID=578462 RepID=A0A0L0SBP9_ALLM3|nr:hypothetical protein AMAG_05360 [Allomyces macrogynus ATCC 38327]|eukprot:KNE59911.1 hypothetical protein AMAG_05360 [Allomyces macrogynus ATCC 38327]
MPRAEHPPPTLYNLDDNDAEPGSCLELCHFSLARFPDLLPRGNVLKTLVIVAQDLDVIGSLACCPLLETLWICETRIESPAPLACCTKLKTLHLYSNRLTTLVGLDHLKALETLWINDNALTDITTLLECSSLVHLNAANNQIQTLPSDLSSLGQIESINVAGNQLYSIDAIKALGTLPSLQGLILEHSFYGTNPVCDLQQYELLALCHVPTLTKLNQRLVSPDMVQTSQQVMDQKQLHYEIQWQTVLSQYMGDVTALKDSIARMAPSLSYLLAYLDWCDAHAKLPPSERALALHHDLAAAIKRSHALMTRRFQQLCLEQCKLRLSHCYLGNVELAPIAATMRVWLRDVVPETMLDAATAIRLPVTAPVPEQDLHVVSEQGDVTLVLRGQLPYCLAMAMVDADDLDVLSVSHFVSREYDEFRAAQHALVPGLIDECRMGILADLDLSHAGLTMLPPVTLPHVTTARLPFNALVDLKQVFGAFPNVETLDVRHNKITRLVDPRPMSLKVIDLSGNVLGADSELILATWHEQLDEVVHDEWLVDAVIQLPASYFLFNEATTIVPPGRCDLRDLDSFQLVTSLSLRNCQLTTVSPLADLAHLEELFIGGNRLTRIDDLAHLPLRVLDASCNAITAVDVPARAFAKLTHLNLSSNRLTSLDMVRTLPRVTELYLAHNHVTDSGHMNALAVLPALHVLDLTGNAFIGAVPHYRAYVIYCVPLIQVLDGVAVTDDEVMHAKGLLVGCLTRAKLLEQMAANGVRTLTCLDLRSCQLMKIECFGPGEFASLAFLNLDNNQIADVSNLVNLRHLRCLSLSGNRIEALPAPKAAPTQPSTGGGGMAAADARLGSADYLWPHLAELYLDQNQVAKMADLRLESLAPDLRILSVRDNKLMRLDGLDKARAVQKLYLDNNQIRMVEPDMVVNLRALKELSLNDNRLKTIHFVRYLPKVKYLHVDRNRITEIVDVAVRTSAALQSISLVGNPIARMSSYRTVLVQAMPGLTRIDGAVITDDEREWARQAAVGDKAQWSVAGPAATGPTAPKQTLRFAAVTLDGSDLLGPQFAAKVVVSAPPGAGGAGKGK